MSKEQIKSALQQFSHASLTENALNLFKTLGYNTERQAPLDRPDYAAFKDSFMDGQSKFNEDKALVKEWRYVDLLFQLSTEELNFTPSLFKKEVTTKLPSGKEERTIIETYLFFALELNKPHYSRTELSQITREVNRLFPMPVMLLFKHGETLTLSVINRRLHKRDESRDVLEKVTLIKDIRIDKPHRAHIEILFDLASDELLRKHRFTNFVELHNAWQKTLDTKELNKRFFQELANWFFWAQSHVQFPNDRKIEEKRNHQINLIRLITRLIFVWFLKEKNLVEERLFDKTFIRKMLKDFDPDSEKTRDYYPAILQNLFFGTLNQKMNERGFVVEGSFHENKEQYGVKTLYRYASLFNIPETEIVKLFKDIPFLNGGLFDCLDKENEETSKVEYVDGFSRNPKKVPFVPDCLFFGKERIVDLTESYGFKKNNEKFRGIIEIFEDYKFTIEENTPIEEEIALDPELLGKVFENLLAYYNPETESTARKQTGSFYTPREIVNYMVDESLIAYLKTQLLSTNPGYIEFGAIQAKLFANDMPGQLAFTETTNKSRWTGKEDELETALRHLIHYNNDSHPFNEQEVQRLIFAIDHCKILDPACGSGAFPMGVLHKLVYLLGKLDEKNIRWRELQKMKAIRDTEEAFNIGDVKIREDKLMEINETFENNAGDYGRKLYLIENCIYGVDIQAIAVQISKLRFFISLVVDQKEREWAENRGIRPLPNLETKFVAANTLIGLDKPKQLPMGYEAIYPLQEKLQKIRHQHFEAKTRKDKLNCQKEDRKIRKQIADKLTSLGFPNNDSDKIARFDIYDQNASADFFDAEWMFGIADGFDIVLGNPPYVQIQSFSGQAVQKQWEAQKYATYAKTGDIYCLFYERGFNLLSPNGVLTYITSNKWMRANYGKAMRKFFLEQGRISQVIDFGDSPIFENATTYTNILILRRDRSIQPIDAWDLSRAYTNEASLEELLAGEGSCQPLFTEDAFVIARGPQSLIKKRIEEVGVPLKKWDVSINYGIKTGLNEAFIINGAKKDELIAKDPKSAEIIKPILRGRDIKRYRAEFADLWLINSHNGYGKAPRINVQKNYPAIWEHLQQVNRETDGGVEKRQDQGDHWSNLRNCAYLPDLEKEKIVFAEIVYDSAFFYDTKGYYPEATSFILTGERLKYLTALLNSKLLTYAFKTFYAGGDLRGNTFRYKKVFLENLPIPKIDAAAQRPYEILVDQILAAKTTPPSAPLLSKEGNKGVVDTSALEKQIDEMVYKLYDLTPEEIAVVEGKG